MSKLLRKFQWLIMLTILVIPLLTACSGGASASGNTKPVDVQVTLTEFGISSSITTFTKGMPYHFVITNKGSMAHEFLIMPPTPATTPHDQALKMALASVGTDQLGPGQTATLDYTFTTAAPAGTLEFACHLPGHYEGGMKEAIVVN